MGGQEKHPVSGLSNASIPYISYCSKEELVTLPVCLVDSPFLSFLEESFKNHSVYKYHSAIQGQLHLVWKNYFSDWW